MEGSRAKERNADKVEMAASEEVRRKRGVAQTRESERRVRKEEVGVWLENVE